MLGRNKTFVKKTKRGKIMKIVREHYLRDDIGTGIGDVLEKDAQCYIIPDTNVVLHQIDLLESPKIKNAIILSTVLNETKNQNVSIYKRLRNIIENKEKHFYVFSNEHHKETYIERRPNETINDRNDRAIRVSALWYSRKLGESKPVFLLTNDAENLKKALDEGIVAKKVHDYVRELTDHPDLLDLLSFTDEPAKDEGPVVGKMAKRTQLYEEHRPMSDIKKGIMERRYYQGKINVKRNNVNEATIEVAEPIEGRNQILIRGFENINRAIHGDIVAVELLPKSQWVSPSFKILEEQKQIKDDVVDEKDKKPTGKVVGIIKRNWRTYCGSIDENTQAADNKLMSVLFVPIDTKIPRIRIQTRQSASLMTKRITVAIDKWDINSKYPDGHYVGTLGDIGDIETESEVILLEHDVPHYDFPEAVLKCLPPDDWCISEEEIKKRTDLRHLTVCSVDPPGCRDIDDALHARKLKNGNFEIGVHIADVTYFVKEGTALDEEAKKRGTTVYLVDRRIDMLPKVLTENLCSLRANVDRLTFSVIFEMTSDAQLVSTKFCKSVIRSRASLTYGEAQAIIDDKTQKGKLARSLRILMKLSQQLKKKRMKSGALTLASPEVRFDLDTETHNPMDVSMYQLKDANSMVEEWMLLANIEVAKQIYKHFPKFACLRRHPAPIPDKFEPLLKSLSTVGIELDIKNSAVLSKSLDKAVIPGNDYFNTLVRMLTTRCMEQAVYFSAGDLPYDEFYHYGLATPIYTHFTSPIRRYADDLVHRYLAASLGEYSLTTELTTTEKIREICDNLNLRNRQAQYADRASVELYTLIYFKDKIVEEEGHVIKVSQNALIVFVPRYGIEGIVYLSEVDEEGPFEYDNEKEQVVHKIQRHIKIRVFDKVKVRIFVKTSANYRRRLIVSIIDPPIDKLLPEKLQPKLPEINPKKRKREEEDIPFDPKRLRL